MTSVANASADDNEPPVQQKTGWHWAWKAGKYSHVDGGGSQVTESAEALPQTAKPHVIWTGALASAVEWTPPPAAAPPVADVSVETAVQPVVPAGPSNGCPAMIYQALGDAGCKISFCESSWNPNATGPHGERGWFQIHPYWHSDSTWDPAGNVAAAVRISRGGTDWSPWSVRSVLSTGRCPNGVLYPV